MIKPETKHPAPECYKVRCKILPLVSLHQLIRAGILNFAVLMLLGGKVVNKRQLT